MAATPESKVKAKIKKILDKYGVYYAMPIGSGYGNAGVPDFLCCANGRFLGVEAKAEKGRATALQEKHLRVIKEGGGHSMIVREDNLSELEDLLKQLCAKQ